MDEDGTGDGSKKKRTGELTIENIYDMAFVELCLTEEQFFSMPPYRTLIMQMQYQRRVDRSWEQTRFIATMVHNTAPGKKRDLRVQDLIALPFDKKTKADSWTQEEAEDLITKWPDIPAN